MKFLKVLLFLQLFPPLSLSADPLASMPFEVGERLEYEISWLGIPGGNSMLEVKGLKEMGGSDAYHVESRTWSNRFISTFYLVDDRIEGYMNAGDLTGISLKVRQREGRHKVDKEISFDRENNKVYFRKNKKKSVHDVPPFIRDSLSSFYYLRTKELEVGKDVVMDTFSNGRLYKLIVKVLKREERQVKGKNYKTIKIQPLIKQNDVFKNKGDIFIWLTDDEYKIPVMIRSEIAIGYFTAELINLRKGDNNGYRSEPSGYPRLSEVQR
ncbi:MAG: DUF3108 domain-containing protein [Deltaproteobacteria bacterium]|nr:DUF3108 domain-containing protein [Deltaproteobacteria bacterium]